MNLVVKKVMGHWRHLVLWPLPDRSLLPALVTESWKPQGGSAQRWPRVLSAIAAFQLGSHTNTQQGTCGSHWNLYSLAKHDQSQKDMDHLSLKLVQPYKVDSLAHFGSQRTLTEWDSCQMHGHFPLATHNFLNCKSCLFIYSFNSYYWESIELENLFHAQV